MNEARNIIEYLYNQPVIDIARVSKITGKSKATNYKMLEDLERLEILKEITGAQRNKLYVFTDYLELFKK
jgi:Fic family protein